MIVFIANRLFLMVLTMIVASFLVFGVMEFSPGNVNIDVRIQELGHWCRVCCQRDGGCATFAGF